MLLWRRLLVVLNDEHHHLLTCLARSVSGMTARRGSASCMRRRLGGREKGEVDQAEGMQRQQRLSCTIRVLESERRRAISRRGLDGAVPGPEGGQVGW